MHMFKRNEMEIFRLYGEIRIECLHNDKQKKINKQSIQISLRILNSFASLCTLWRLSWKRSLFFHSYSYQLRFSIVRKKISFPFLHYWFLFVRLIRKISIDHITLEPSNGFSPLVGSNSRAFVSDKTWQCSGALFLIASSPLNVASTRVDIESDNFDFL